MIRLGLCCIFRKEPIRFRATTAAALRNLPRAEQTQRLSRLCVENSQSLLEALRFLVQRGIGAFRVTSPFFPRITHPEVGYTLEELPDQDEIRHHLSQVRQYRQEHDIRLSLHPDQFIILSSPQRGVVENAMRELEYQGFLGELIGAERITIHGGGGYDNKKEALQRLAANFRHLTPRVKKRLSLENDDKIYTVRDLAPVCEELGVPLVYDVHHHRCNPDGLSVDEATRLALRTWQRIGREPYFHISSPRNGWHSGSPRAHADYIDPKDFPDCWKDLTITVDVEAKAKELAVLELRRVLGIVSRKEQSGDRRTL
jgi:UV DNA damage endonuclease